MLLDRLIADCLPTRAMVPTMQLLWIDGRLCQAFDETSGRPGVWVPIQAVTTEGAQTFRMVDPTPPTKD